MDKSVKFPGMLQTFRTLVDMGDGTFAERTLAQPPAQLLTLGYAANTRLRVDVGQTGFFEGREFRVVRKLTSPVVYRFTAPVPFIIFEQALSVSEGDIEMYVWSADNVTIGGTWTPVPVFAKNGVNTTYTRQLQVDVGGTVTPINSSLYRDYARVATAGATAQRNTVGGPANSERYLPAATYYVQFTGVGVGAYSLVWEERPPSP